MQANQTYPVPPLWNSLSHSNSDSGLNCFSQLSCGRWICKKTGDRNWSHLGERMERSPRGRWEKGWKGEPVGKVAGRDAGWETSLEFGVRWGHMLDAVWWILFTCSSFLDFLAVVVFVAVGGLSLVVASRCCSSLLCAGFSLWWACCRAWAPLVFKGLHCTDSNYSIFTLCCSHTAHLHTSQPGAHT